MSFEEANVLRESVGAARTVGAHERVLDDESTRLGVQSRPFIDRRARLFHYDRDRGVGGQTIVVDSDKAGVMSVDTAARMLRLIHIHFGLERQLEDDLLAFDNAMFWCQVINGSSEIQPTAGVMFYVRDSAFAWADVLKIVGNEPRRFFRAYATEIVAYCRRLYDKNVDVTSDVMEKRDFLNGVAMKAGVPRFPWLASDVSEHATGLDGAEVMAAVQIKGHRVGGTPNAVDGRRAAPTIRSLDNMDSSNGRSVSRDNDITPQYSL